MSVIPAILQVMAYDVELAHRIRAAMQDEPDLSERAMFGGLGFMLAGHMVAAAHSRGGLMLRVDPQSSRALVDAGGAQPFAMHGRTMAGWLDVAPSVVAHDQDLHRWLQHGVTYVRTLPPKD